MEILELVKAGGPSIGTVIVILVMLGRRLGRIEEKIDNINGKVQSHAVRIAVVEERTDAA